MKTAAYRLRYKRLSDILSVQFNRLEGPTLSNTQQEIATPKACKQRNRSVFSTIVALIFIVLAIVCYFFFHDNQGAITLISVVLCIVEGAIAVYAVEGKILPTKIILDVLTVGVAIIICYGLISSAKPGSEVSAYIYAATTIAMALLLVCLNIIKPVDAKSGTRTTRYLTYTATFIALSVLFKMLGNTVSSIIIIPNMRLSFVYVPWVLSGIVLGPIGGVLTALISDVLGQLTIAVGGAINPLTTLSNAMFPLAPALIFRANKFIKDEWLKILVGMNISLIVCTMGIGAYALYSYYNYGSSMSFWTYLLTIRSPQIIIIAVNYFLCLLLLPIVKKLRLSEKLKEAAA